MEKIRRILRESRVWILLLLVILSIISIPTFNPEGVQVSYVLPDSPFAGRLSEGDVITHMNGQRITSTEQYQEIFSGLALNDTISFKVDDAVQKATVLESAGEPYIGVHITSSQSTNIDLGLDLQGGARVVLNPIPVEGINMTPELMDTTMEVLIARMNVYGLKNVVLRRVQDVEGNTFVSVEMAGEGSEKVVDIIKSVGKFELKLMNKTVLTGEYIVPPIGEPQQDLTTGAWEVPFTLNAEGARLLQEEYVKIAPDNPETCTRAEDCDPQYACAINFGSGMCLPRIEMFLDNKNTFSAPPSQSLHATWLTGENYKNLRATSPTEDKARSVKVVLEAGRLPETIERLDVISQDYVDPTLGKGFIRGALYAAIAAILAITIVVFIRYRKLKILLPILFVDISEIILIIGLAGLINWSIDLPAIAGIIMVLGTAVDQQIVITDEVLAGKVSKSWSLNKQVKIAFQIVTIAVFTTIAAMAPLAYPAFTGLYALRGFATVTILGVLIGLIITRPAYAKMAAILLQEE